MINFSFGCRSVRTSPRSLHADNEAQHQRLRGTDAQDIRLKAGHPGHPMKRTAANRHVYIVVRTSDVAAGRRAAIPPPLPKNVCVRARPSHFSKICV